MFAFEHSTPFPFMEIGPGSFPIILLKATPPWQRWNISQQHFTIAKHIKWVFFVRDGDMIVLIFCHDFILNFKSVQLQHSLMIFGSLFWFSSPKRPCSCSSRTRQGLFFVFLTKSNNKLTLHHLPHTDSKHTTFENSLWTHSSIYQAIKPGDQNKA